MNDKAERWLAEQEIALLERIYALESPPEREDTREMIRVEAHKVRVSKPARNSSPSNGAITG
jgi:hypothetical protein